MGLPARKIEHERHGQSRSASRAAAGRRVSRTRRAAHTSTLVVRGCAVAIAVLAFAGIGRVAIAVRAAEAAIDAHRLERSIRSELLESRELEADCSALEAPSRIGALASNALNMRATSAPKYICVPARHDAEGTQSKSVAQHGSVHGGSALAALLEDLVSGEAQALLVGDVGIASSR
ncbi:MAG: hypothetical protein N3B11_02140 [Coriobacteriia bacterium]|nr:hypothetical protein [Coriobacteriia bacterium]